MYKTFMFTKCIHCLIAGTLLHARPHHTTSAIFALLKQHAPSVLFLTNCPALKQTFLSASPLFTTSSFTLHSRQPPTAFVVNYIDLLTL